VYKNVGSLLMVFFLSSCAGFQVERVFVRGNSLSPMIKNGEEIKLYRGYYKKRKIGRGDIVAFNYTGREVPVIKIIKAVGGDKFSVRELKDNRCELIINGKVLKDWRGLSYTFSSKKKKMLKLYEKDFKGTVPEGFYLVFGVGNCDACLDSGRFGFLFGDKIIGKIKK